MLSHMGKGGAPSAPNYAAVAMAQMDQSQKQFELGQEQLQFGKDQFDKTWPYAQQFLQNAADTQAQEASAAKQQQDVYSNVELPQMKKFIDEGNNWASPARQQQEAGGAMADVAQAFDQNRAASLQNLESYGIDPSQTRYQALDLGTRISQAAATAAAGTQAAKNTQAQGLALQGEGINMLAGFPTQIAQSYSTATGAGQSSILGANQTTNTGVNAMGSPTQWNQLGNQSQMNAVNTMHTQYSDQLAGAQMEAGQQSNMMSGIGGVVGIAATAAIAI
jgi:hypothetical protein